MSQLEMGRLQIISKKPSEVKKLLEEYIAKSRMSFKEIKTNEQNNITYMIGGASNG